jgi:hypothetical protein
MKTALYETILTSVVLLQGLLSSCGPVRRDEEDSGVRIDGQAHVGYLTGEDPGIAEEQAWEQQASERNVDWFVRMSEEGDDYQRLRALQWLATNHPTMADQFQTLLKDHEEYLRVVERVVAILERPIPPPLEYEQAWKTMVVAVEASGQVVLGIGGEQLVQKGHHFTIYRQDSFVAKVEVVKVLACCSIAELVFTREGFEIKVGDLVETPFTLQGRE